MRRLSLAAASGFVAAALALPAAAPAASVSLSTHHPCDDVPPDEVTPGCDVPPNAIVRVLAARGERNLLRASVSGEAGGVWTVRVADAGAPLGAGPGCAASAPGEVECGGTFGLVTLDVRTGDGDDRVAVVSAQHARVDAGAGADEVTGGAGADVLSGGGGGRDRVAGGSGRDALADGDAPDAPDADALDGGGGADLVRYAGRRGRVTVDLARSRGGEAGEGDRLEGLERAQGGRGGDLLRGDRRANVLAGGPGADRIACRAGRDLVESPSWVDVLGSDCERAGDPDWLTLRAAPVSLGARSALLRASCSDAVFAERCRGSVLVRRAGGRGAAPAARFSVPRGRSRAVRVPLAAPDARAVRRGGLRVQVIVRLALPRDARSYVRRSFGYATRFGG